MDRRACVAGLLVLVAASRPALAQAPGDVASVTPLHRTGKYHLGVSAEPMYVGAIEAITSHGHTHGLDIGVAAQIDIDTHWAIRLPLELGAGGFGQGAGYGELAFVPGAVYRFRTTNDQRWVPYVGGGLRVGFVGIGRSLVGEPLIVACCHSWGGSGWEGGGGGGKSDPNTDNAFIGLSPEAWGGEELQVADWLSLQFAGALGYENIVSTNVFVLRATLGLRLSL